MKREQILKLNSIKFLNHVNKKLNARSSIKKMLKDDDILSFDKKGK